MEKPSSVINVRINGSICQFRITQINGDTQPLDLNISQKVSISRIIASSLKPKEMTRPRSSTHDGVVRPRSIDSRRFTPAFETVTEVLRKIRSDVDRKMGRETKRRVPVKRMRLALKLHDDIEDTDDADRTRIPRPELEEPVLPSHIAKLAPPTIPDDRFYAPGPIILKYNRSHEPKTPFNTPDEPKKKIRKIVLVKKCSFRSGTFICQNKICATKIFCANHTPAPPMIDGSDDFKIPSPPLKVRRSRVPLILSRSSRRPLPVGPSPPARLSFRGISSRKPRKEALVGGHKLVRTRRAVGKEAILSQINKSAFTFTAVRTADGRIIDEGVTITDI